jgi:lipopolysaccharide export system protein LptA
MIKLCSQRTALHSLLATLCVLGAIAHAQPAQPPAAAAEEPSTTILSDTLHYDDIKRESTFTGKVVMTRGFLTMNADVLQMREDKDGNQFGEATMKSDKLVLIRQLRPENFEVLEGVGQRAEYDGKNETFDLIGKAVVSRYICGKHFDTVSGQQVRYNQKTDVYQAFSGPNSANADGRVRSVAQPKARTEAAVAECKARQDNVPPTPAAKPTGKARP